MKNFVNISAFIFALVAIGLALYLPEKLGEIDLRNITAEIEKNRKDCDTARAAVVQIHYANGTMGLSSLSDCKAGQRGTTTLGTPNANEAAYASAFNAAQDALTENSSRKERADDQWNTSAFWFRIAGLGALGALGYFLILALGLYHLIEFPKQATSIPDRLFYAGSCCFVGAILALIVCLLLNPNAHDISNSVGLIALAAGLCSDISIRLIRQAYSMLRLQF